MSPESVSYVVTVYNKAGFLAEVLASIARERAATGGEIILVDDGSTDSSPGLLASFAASQAETIVVTQPNKGVAAATNTGIARASRPYLRLVDGDDVLRDGSTSALIAAQRRTGRGFVFGGFSKDSRSLRTDPGTVTLIDDPLSAMLTRQPFIPATTLGLTALMQQALPLPEDIRTSQDFALGLRLAALTRFAAIDHTCCISPAASTGLSSEMSRMFRDTVLLAARLGQEQGWSGRCRRLALSRNAGRARNYLRRHCDDCRGTVFLLTVLAALTRIPFCWPYRRIMDYIARAYLGRD